MPTIKIISVGKTKEQWLDTAIQEYVKRLKNTVTISFEYLKDDTQLLTTISKHKNILALDPTGKMMTSKEFSSFLHKQWMNLGAHINMIIGGADGLPQQIKQNHTLISLSPMTFTHQITRLILVEQIYRAIEIAKGSPYHK